MRVGLSLALFMWISTVAFFFDPLNLPYRGEAAKVWASYATLASLVLCGALVFVVVDATRRATRLIRCITDRRTRWPDRVIAKHVRETGPPERHLEDWIDFRAVVELTKSVNTFIYFPFVLLLLVVAQHLVPDSLNFPLPLVAVLCGAVLYLVYCAMSLRSTAENARSVALTHYRDQLLLAKSGQVPDVPTTSGVPVDAEKRRAQLEEIIERIKSTKDGAFAPLLQQPFLKGLLIPFGGFGGMSLLEDVRDLPVLTGSAQTATLVVIRLDSQIAMPDAAIGAELARAASPGHAPALDDRVVIGERDEPLDVLVDDEDGLAGPAQHRQALPDLLADERRQALGRLVEDQQMGIRHQCAPDRKHLLLATRKLVAHVIGALLQTREKLIDPLESTGPWRRCGCRRRRSGFPSR